MLKVLFVLALIGLGVSFAMTSLVNKKLVNGKYIALSIIQFICLGAMVGLLLVLIMKGRALV